VYLLSNGAKIRYPRKQIGKHILEVKQSTAGLPLLSSRQYGKHVFVKTNNFHGYAQETNEFDGYPLAYIRSRVIFDKRITWRLHTEITEAKPFRTFIRIYSLLKSERLNANIKLTLQGTDQISNDLTLVAPGN
jgi:hypothetical protein